MSIISKLMFIICCLLSFLGTLDQFCASALVVADKYSFIIWLICSCSILFVPQWAVFHIILFILLIHSSVLATEGIVMYILVGCSVLLVEGIVFCVLVVHVFLFDFGLVFLPSWIILFRSFTAAF